MHARIIAAALSALLLAGAPGCAALKPASVVESVADAKADALRAVAGAYETLAAAREAVLVGHLGGVIDRTKALRARDALNDVGDAIAAAEALIESGLIEQGMLALAVTVARAEQIVKEARG